MLINTVLLFLHNALPVFIITSLLLRYFSVNNIELNNRKWLLFCVFLTIMASFFLSSNLESLSQEFSGKGSELFLSVGAILVYLSIITLIILSNIHHCVAVKKCLAFITFFIISSINGAHFIIYLLHYWTQAQQEETIVVGIILGGGICLSITILFYFLLRYMDKNIYSKISGYFLLFFALGQLMQAIVFLQQVDILSSSQPVWDSGHLIAENSGIGQLLTVLFGYETTPSLLQLFIYTVALIIPLVCTKLPYILLFLNGKKS